MLMLMPMLMLMLVSIINIWIRPVTMGLVSCAGQCHSANVASCSHCRFDQCQ
jgi:hypothetical protein